jgi:hypothetical protein
MALGIDVTYGPQEPEWEAVLAQVRDFEDALALASLFEIDTLYANELPLDALATGAAFLSDRGLADLLAQHLMSLAPCTYTYLDLYSPTRGRDGSRERIAALVRRCCAAGVELHHRERPPTPWNVVVAQLASDADRAAFAELAQHYTANSWWIDLEVDLAMPAPASSPATPAQVADLVARCRRAGVVLRRIATR